MTKDFQKLQVLLMRIRGKKTQTIKRNVLILYFLNI